MSDAMRHFFSCSWPEFYDRLMVMERTTTRRKTSTNRRDLKNRNLIPQPNFTAP